MKALEIFKSHQGEGRYTGTLMTFVRFKVCKRPFSKTLCSMCDTMTKMTSCVEMTFEPKDLEKSLRDSNYNICFTGGEPSIYLKDIKNIIDCFDADINSHVTGCVHFETNGFNLLELASMLKKTRLNDDKYFIAYSPKFFEDEPKTVLADHVKFLHENENMFMIKEGRYSIKIVVGENNIDLCNTFLDSIPKRLLPLVYLMPMGVTEGELKVSMPHVSKLSMEFKVNISDRLHIIHSYM